MHRWFSFRFPRTNQLLAECSLSRNVAGIVNYFLFLTRVNNMFTIAPMIRTFADTETKRFFTTGKSKRFPPDVLKRAVKRMTQIDAATVIDDLRMPPSNRLESLTRDRAGQWSIRINEQWRVCFRFENGEAYNVEIVDYH